MRHAWKITNQSNAFCNLMQTASVCMCGSDGTFDSMVRVFFRGELPMYGYINAYARINVYVHTYHIYTYMNMHPRILITEKYIHSYLCIYAYI
jgi:hypothetical protein